MHIKQAEFIGAIAAPSQAIPSDLLQVAFAGRSNVGKSSLINALVGRKRLARVSATPGKTQEINFYLINESFLITDLPGYGFAKAPLSERSRWHRLVEGYLSRPPGPAGVVVLFDSRRGLLDADRPLLDFLSELELSTLFVLTKIDKLNRAARRKVETEVGEELDVPADQVLATSARTGEGLKDLSRSLADCVQMATQGR
ncbi:MAG: ribosome biogenesis GTP-binding protein YihA/YsxC [Gemmatimonadota bacterium]